MHTNNHNNYNDIIESLLIFCKRFARLQPLQRKTDHQRRTVAAESISKIQGEDAPSQA
jgi:hypothetical protein